MPGKKRFSPCSNQVIGCAIRVHTELGPGLFESIYAKALASEFKNAGVPFQQEIEISATYRGEDLGCGFRADFIVGNELIVELKSVQTLKPIHRAQLLTYLKLARIKHGLLINFNVRRLPDGLKSFVL